MEEKKSNIKARQYQLQKLFSITIHEIWANTTPIMVSDVPIVLVQRYYKIEDQGHALFKKHVSSFSLPDIRES